MNESQSVPLQGWTASPNYPGTVDIIINNCVTLVLCRSTVLCLSVVPSTYSRWRQSWRKFLVAIMTFIGREFTFQAALGQGCSACRSVGKFQHSGNVGWTMRHAFLADMGGFVLQPRISTSESATEDWASFPLDAEQVHCLAVNKYIPYSAVGPPGVKIDDTKDRNKVDGLVRLITVLRTLWFLVGVIGRAFQYLEITISQLATIEFIACTLGTSFWRHKTVDFGHAIIIRPEKATLQEIMINAGKQAQRPYRRTPLDFVGMEQWSWDIHWTYWLGMLTKFLGIRFFSRRRPIQKIPDDYYPALTKTSMVILFFFQTG